MKIRELLTEAVYDKVADAIKRAHPDQAVAVDAELAWAKTALKRPDRVNWYMLVVKNYFNDTLPQVQGNYNFTSLDQLHHDLIHFYGFNAPSIEAYAYKSQNIGELIGALDQLLAQHQEAERNRPRPVTTRQGDHVLFDFGSGVQWWWVDRAYCSDEGRSGKHCGNVVGRKKTDQRLLSLRKDGHVLLTFVLEPDGSLGEMKARGNQKPAARYHSYIAKLLMWDQIIGITGEGYLPDANFSMFDLSPADLDFFDTNKPRLIVDQCRVTPIEILRAPDSIKKKYQRYIEDPAIRGLLTDSSVDNWVRVLVDNPRLILFAPHDVPNFEQKLLYYCKNVSYPGMLLKAPNSISRNPDLLSKILQVAPWLIAGVNPSVPGYRELCWQAVRKDGICLRWVAESARDELMCQLAIQSTTDVRSVMLAVPEEIKNSDAIWMTAVRQEGLFLEHVPRQKLSRELCLAAVQNRGRALGEVPEEFKDYQMCLTAVTADGSALQYVPDKLQDTALRTAAVQSYGVALGMIPWTKRNKELCTAAVRQNGHALHYVPESLKNRTMCLLAVKQDGKALQWVPIQYRDYWLCLDAVKKDGMALKEVPTELQDRDLCMAAVRQDSYAIAYVPRAIKNKL